MDHVLLCNKPVFITNKHCQTDQGLFGNDRLSLIAGPVFGNRDFFTGLGVFVDTYPNEEKLLEVQE